MSQPPSFKIYRVESNVYAHPGYAICTVFRNPGGYLKAESFVLFQTSEEDGSSVGCKISFPSNDPKFPITIDEEFAADEALRQAEIDFSINIHEKNFSSPHPLNWPKKKFVEIPKQQLVSVLAHTPLREHLSSVGDNTRCEILSEYINLFRSLPTISRSPIAL